jgi:cyclophilin family peptidyl-prolyl cis-trans isomerase
MRGAACALLTWLVLGGEALLRAAPTADGLYATFAVKRGAAGVGEFSCRLEFTTVPRTVANFVGLAEGARPFVDFQRGHATKRSFYDGLTFHRVVAGFVIQGGSPKGDGSDGPGYTFRDEFEASLRHSRAGILAMANSGTNSNGSQFFVTLDATPWLDDVHSVFGEVAEGLSVVNSVRQGDVIERVTIVRNGAAAQAFDANAHGLPVVAEANPVLVPTLAGFELNYGQPANAEFFVFHSDALTAWSRLAGKELEGVNPVVGPRDDSAVTAAKAMTFFNVARVQYPDAIFTPPSVVGKRLSLANVSSAGTFALDFSLTDATAGTYVLTPGGSAPLGPHPVSTYTWEQEAYRGRLGANISGLSAGNDPINRATISYVFSSSTGGSVAGSLSTLLGQTLPLAGIFTVSDLP